MHFIALAMYVLYYRNSIVLIVHIANIYQAVELYMGWSEWRWLQMRYNYAAALSRPFNSSSSLVVRCIASNTGIKLINVTSNMIHIVAHTSCHLPRCQYVNYTFELYYASASFPYSSL